MSIKGILSLAAKGRFIALPVAATLAFAAPAAAEQSLSDAIRGYSVAKTETTARSIAGEFKSLEQAIKVADVLEREAGYKTTTKVIGSNGTYTITQDTLNAREFRQLAYIVGIKRDWRTGAEILVGQQKLPDGKTLFWEAPIPKEKGAELKYSTRTNG